MIARAKIGALVTVVTLSAYSALDAYSKNTQEEQPFPQYKWAFIDKNGKLVIPPVFTVAKDFSNGLAAVGKTPMLLTASDADRSQSYDGTWGFIDKRGKEVIPQRLRDCGQFGDQLAPFQAFDRDNNWGYINRNGEVKIPASFVKADQFSDGLAAVLSRNPSDMGVYGYINTTGALAISPQFCPGFLGIQGTFKEGLAPVVKQMPASDDRNNTLSPRYYCYIDHRGAVKIPGPFIEAESFSDGLAAVVVPNIHAPGVSHSPLTKRCYIDTKGVIKIAGSFLTAGPFSEGLAPVLVPDKGGYGYIDKSGKLVIPPQYNKAEPFSDGLALVEKQGKQYFIDRTGRTAIKGPLISPHSFHEGLARIMIKVK